MSSPTVEPGSWWLHRATGTVEQMVYTEHVCGQGVRVGLREPAEGRSRELSVEELLSGAYEPV